jgi:hypothetical protein
MAAPAGPSTTPPFAAPAAPADSASSAVPPAPKAPAHSAAPADSTPPPSGVLRVETIPSGLQVLVDGVEVGRSPIDSLRLPAKAVLVRVLSADPRRFDSARDALPVTIRAGATVTVFLDLRPSVLLRSDPEPAFVLLVDRPGDLPDSLLGETPLTVKPAWIEGAGLRFGRESFADTVLASSAFLDPAQKPPRVALRRSGLPAPRLGPAPRTSLFRKRWVQWSLIGVGAALSGAAVAFHQQGDEWYDRYLASSNVDEIPDLYDRAARYDRYAAFSLGTGQVCLIGGLLLLFSGQSR